MKPLSQSDFALSKQGCLLPNGIRLAYAELGDRGGTPVLLLHGFTDSARSWSLVAPYLAAGLRLIAPDLRGHGHSDKPEGCYTIPELAHDLRLFLAELGIAQAHIVGHSLGGRLAQALAERWPKIVRKIVLMSTSAVPRERAGWLWNNIVGLGDPIDPDGDFVRAWCAGTVPVDEEFLFHVRRECAAVPARIWHSVYYEQTAYDPLPLLRDISAPTLIMRGKHDDIATSEHQSQMLATIGGAKLITLPGLGHNMHWEAPGLIAGHIRSFLQRA
jgi:pimeloyl-ACP methyl ester carboxylesterase